MQSSIAETVDEWSGCICNTVMLRLTPFAQVSRIAWQWKANRRRKSTHLQQGDCTCSLEPSKRSFYTVQIDFV